MVDAIRLMIWYLHRLEHFGRGTTKSQHLVLQFWTLFGKKLNKPRLLHATEDVERILGFHYLRSRFIEQF